MMKHKNFLLLFAALCLTACESLFPSLPGNITPGGNSGTPMSADAAYKVVQAKLEPFARRGIFRSRELVPAETMLSFMPPGKTEPENTVLVKSPTWVFYVGPDANANGTDEWMYVYVNSLNGDWGGQILTGELVGLLWETVRERAETPDNFTLYYAETVADPTFSRWVEIAERANDLAKDGQHAWIRRFDSDEALEAAFKGAGARVKPDWETQTLLLVAGVETNQNYPFDLMFSKQENGSYQATVYRTESTATSLIWWSRAILVDKLPADAALSVKALYLGQ